MSTTPKRNRWEKRRNLMIQAGRWKGVLNPRRNSTPVLNCGKRSYCTNKKRSMSKLLIDACGLVDIADWRRQKWGVVVKSRWMVVVMPWFPQYYCRGRVEYTAEKIVFESTTTCNRLKDWWWRSLSAHLLTAPESNTAFAFMVFLRQKQRNYPAG